MKKTVSRATLAVAFITMITVGCGMMKKSPTKMAHTPVEQAYYDWVEQVGKSTGENPEGVLNLYADNGILMPTLSPKVLTDQSMRKSYFRSFLAIEDKEIKTVKLISKTHGDIAMNCGLYSFTFKQNGKIKTLHCRFDFWYKKIDGEWKIIFHQSSVLPKAVM